ncbi:TIGR00269 family protein [Candidatus Woesearchaeota archaeon]|nr:TIGR00269 family protein [Candidatus Woesearchaeota archaeon]
MDCSLCKQPAVSVSPCYCKEHFIAYFENKVATTIKRFKLLKKSEKAGVAVSGGKDSLSLLYLLHKSGYNVTALAVDEGIKGYREKTIKKMVSFCKKRKIRFKVSSFREEFGKPLDDMLKNKEVRPCTVCGILRRQLLNKMSRQFDVLATGHNMDDEAQAVMMNLLKGSTELMKRQGPVSGAIKIKRFTKRIKPFYYCGEKEVMIYSFLNGIITEFAECPNIGLSFRLRIKESMNEIETRYPGTKKNTLDWFIKRKDGFLQQSSKENICERCGEPSANNVCNSCRLVQNICA